MVQSWQRGRVWTRTVIRGDCDDLVGEKKSSLGWVDAAKGKFTLLKSLEKETESWKAPALGRLGINSR